MAPVGDLGDTLIMVASWTGVQEILNVNAQVGIRFGMELYCDKFHVVEVNTHSDSNWRRNTAIRGHDLPWYEYRALTLKRKVQVYQSVVANRPR